MCIRDSSQAAVGGAEPWPPVQPGVQLRGFWPKPTFFEIRFKIKWLEKECIFQNFDQNKVHFNQNLGSKSSRFQSKAIAAADLVTDLARRAWLRRTQDDGGTTFRFRIFRRRGGGGTWPKSIFFKIIQNKVAGERIELNFDQNSDQNKVFLKEICRSK